MLTAVQSLTGRLTGRRRDADGGRPSGRRVPPLPILPGRPGRAAGAGWGRLGRDGRVRRAACAPARPQPGDRPVRGLRPPPRRPHALRRCDLSAPFQFMTSWTSRAGGGQPSDHRRRPRSLGSRGAPRVAQGRARGQARRRRAGRLEQEHDPDPVPRPAARRGRLVRPGGDRHGAVAEGAGVGHRRAAGRRGAAAARGRHRAEHGRRPGHAGAPRRRGSRQRVGGRLVASRSTASRPTTSPSFRPTRAAACSLPADVAGGDHRPGRPGGVARRDAPGAHRGPAAPRARMA